jgi:RHS repeat-associated protein
VITDEAGVVVERLAYDPWGKRRNANGNTDPTDSLVGLSTDRGYTQHEHLDEVGVIHMNGRVFDPLIGRFMSADPFIQAPFELQSHNRYAYVVNNPLAFTDPSGYFGLFNEIANLGSTVSRVWRQDVYPNPILQIVITAYAYSQCGPTCAAYTAAGYSAASTYDRTGSLESAAKAGLISYGTAMAMGAVGGNSLTANGFANVAAHALVGCVSSVAGGGSCRSGAWAGAISSAWANYGHDFNDLAADSVANGIAGGVGSVLGGGKFENGAVTGAFGYLFNKYAHNRRVLTVANGVISEMGWSNPQNHGADFGFRVKIATIDGKQVWIYAHMDPDTIKIFENQVVLKGTYIGDYASPANGNASGPHLHLELRNNNGTPVLNQGDVNPVPGGKISSGINPNRVVKTNNGLQIRPHNGTDWIGAP